MTATSPPTTMGSSLLFWLCISVGCTPCKEHENERTQFRWWLTQNNTLIAILIVVFIQCTGLCQGWHLQLESQIPRWVLFRPILIEASCSHTFDFRWAAPTWPSSTPWATSATSGQSLSRSGDLIVKTNIFCSKVCWPDHLEAVHTRDAWSGRIR